MKADIGAYRSRSNGFAVLLTKLGHEVRLMPAKDVKAYIKRNKNDAADAEAICEAVRRPTMRFVGVKSAEQQGRLMQHRTRDLLVRQRRAAPCRTCLPTWRAETIAWLNGLISAVVADLNAPHIVTHPADFLPDAHCKAVGEKRREPS
jgi:hypothetical protein